jgi:hypothetical protein
MAYRPCLLSSAHLVPSACLSVPTPPYPNTNPRYILPAPFPSPPPLLSPLPPPPHTHKTPGRGEAVDGKVTKEIRNKKREGRRLGKKNKKRWRLGKKRG